MSAAVSSCRAIRCLIADLANPRSDHKKPNPTPGEPPNYDLSIPEPAIPAGLELLQAHIYFRHGERTPVKERLTHLGIPSRWNMCTAGKEFAVGVLNDPDTRSQKSELMLLRKRVERGGSGSSSSLGDISEWCVTLQDRLRWRLICYI